MTPWYSKRRRRARVVGRVIQVAGEEELRTRDDPADERSTAERNGTSEREIALRSRARTQSWANGWLSIRRVAG